MVSYLKEYVERVADLPAELQRRFAMIKDLESRAVKAQQDVIDDLKQNHKRPRIRADAVDDVLSLTEEKIRVAGQIYDLVDRHIRALDEDLKSLEAGNLPYREKLGLEENQKACEVLGLPLGKENKGKAAAAPIVKPKKKKGRKKASEGHDLEGQAVAQNPGTAAKTGAVDESEPLYCSCHRISFGDMIACDNNECPIEWFHYECVGLTSVPKGKWYCPDCRPFMKASTKKGK